MRWKWTLVFCSAALIGCTTGPTSSFQEALRIEGLVRVGLKAEQVCQARLKANPRYSRLYAKLAIDANAHPSPRQLSDPEHPTNDDIEAGLDWYAEAQHCDDTFVEQMGRIDPELGIYGANYYRAATDVVVDIVKTRPTIGSINEKIRDFRTTQRAAAQQMMQRLEARLREENQQELAAREEARQQFASEVGAVTETLANLAVATVDALAAQQLALQQERAEYVAAHPAYAPLYRMTITRCQWLGSIWTCTQN